MKSLSFVLIKLTAITTLSFLAVLWQSCGSDSPVPETLPVVSSVSPTSGGANTLVTITGTNFSSVITENKVTFKGREAVATAANANQITVSVPAEAETGPVVVIVKGKTAANQPLFTVTPEQVPEVNTISPASGMVNTPVIITGNNFSSMIADIKVAFTGADAIVTAATTTQLTLTVPSLAKSGPVVVTVKGKTAINHPEFIVTAVPVVTTSPVTILTMSSASGGGNVISDGGSTVTFRGLCWSITNQTPSVNDNKTLNGNGTGTFTTPMTALAHGARYYARAYATNSNGTGYGDVVIFTVLAVGQFYQGGIIAYIYQPGDPGYVEGESHGLISSDKTSGLTEWASLGQVTLITGATGTALGTGLANTIKIVEAPGLNYSAAKNCFEVIINGYDDWFLPSKEELNQLYINRAAIGEFVGTYYWSSTEANTTAYIQSFTTGVQSTYAKNGKFYVREVRYF